MYTKTISDVHVRTCSCNHNHRMTAEYVLRTTSQSRALANIVTDVAVCQLHVKSLVAASLLKAVAFISLPGAHCQKANRHCFSAVYLFMLFEHYINNVVSRLTDIQTSYAAPAAAATQSTLSVGPCSTTAHKGCPHPICPCRHCRCHRQPNTTRSGTPLNCTPHVLLHNTHN